jgi:quinol monooxygenase YgiN
LIGSVSFLLDVVTVVARYRAKPGEGDSVAAVLSWHVPATRAEPGCIQFDACRSTDDPDEFVLYEKYVDEAAFESHRASPHFQKYVLGEIVPRLDERTWQRYREVGA